MSGLDAFAHWTSPGPVASAFLADRKSDVRAILGPQGSGKTVSCIVDQLRNSTAMPVCTDGAIRFRVGIVRDTYGRLDETTIKTWNAWIPQDAGEWSGGGGRAARHCITYDTIRDGCRIPVHFEAIFAALGDQKVEDFMRGFEVTSFWFNEMDLLNEEVLTLGLGRIGRYPRAADIKDRLPYRSFITGDLNAPDIDSWFYKTFEEDKPQGYALYKQPGGRSARAENLHNLKAGYYADQVRLNAHKKKWIKRFVDALYGPSDDGQPIYEEYSDEIHLAREPIKARKGVPIRIGLDAGMQRPAGVIVQWLPTGQWLVLREVVPGRMGAKRFAELLKREIAETVEEAGGAPVGPAYADPAGFAGADHESDQYSWSETVAAELGIHIEPAPSNEVSLRLDAVRDELTYMIDPHTPAMQVSPGCKMIRKGFASHYRYGVQIVAGNRRTSDKPEKNDFSHPHDALQYVVLGSKGRHGVIGGDGKHRRPNSTSTTGATVLRSGWRPF